MLWSPAYLAAPTKGTSRARIAGILRDVKSRIRMTMEQEHEWGPYTTEDTGKHKAGRVRVAAIGDLAARNALVNVPEGALFILEDGLDHTLQIYDEATWKTVGIPQHADLEDLGTVDAHPQYVRIDNAHNTDWEFDLDGNYLASAGGAAQTRDGFMLAHHAFTTDQPHPEWWDRLAMNSPMPGNVFFSPEEVDFTVDSLATGLPNERSGICYFPGLFFTPNVRVTAGATPDGCRFCARTISAAGLPNTEEFGLQIQGWHPFTIRLRGYRARIVEP